MPYIELYQNKNTEDVVLCSFVFCKELGGGNTPTGPLIYLPLDYFMRNSVEIVMREFDLFYTRDYEIRSQLRDEMTKAEQRKFRSRHSKVTLSWPFKDKPVNVYAGKDDELYGHLSIPLDQADFSAYIIGALAKGS